MSSNSEYEILKNGNQVTIKFHGFLKEENLKGFLDEYEKLKKSVNVKDTDLILDGKELKVFPKESESELSELYKDYVCFKKIYVITSDDLISKMQLKRILNAAGLSDKFEFINSVNDIK